MFKRLVLALLVCLPVLAVGAERELPLAADFHADAAQARALKRPILVFFAAESCPYCHAVETLYLTPLYNGGAYTDKLLIRVVRVERDARVRDFAGRSTTHAAFAESYGVKLTPVVKLLDANGKELVPALIGYSSPDFYGAYLEQSIDAAIAAAARLPG
jgi:thioredoxin-related protein